MTGDPIPDGPAVERFVGRVFRLTSEPVRYPDGRRSQHDVIRHPGAVAVLPISSIDPLEVVLLHQWRTPVGGRLWEIPAGTLDKPGEPPHVCAQRELIEETGLRAGTLRQLGRFFTAPGFCDERMWLYVAWDLSDARDEQAALDNDEVLSVERVRWPELQAMIDAGEIEDAKTLIALYWLRSLMAAPAEARTIR